MEPTGDGYTPTPHHSRKDTKKWCKGKVGREHDFQVGMPSNGWDQKGCRAVTYNFKNVPTKTRWICRHMIICQKCGKQDWAAKFKCPDNPANIKRDELWDFLD